MDRDFDSNNYTSNIYTTPCYSIENLYCSEQVLKRILKNEFMLNEADREFKSIINLFNKNQNDFHSAASLFNTWYALAKKKAEKQNSIVNASLNDKFPKGFISIKIGEIKSNYNLKKIKEKFPQAIDISENEIADFEKIFCQTSPLTSYRGKYEIEFFITFLKFIIEDANKNKKILSSRTKFSIDNAQVLSQLSQYSETPECLTQYIKNCA